MADAFEAALAETERQVESALKLAAASVRELRKARSAARGGQVRDLRRALAAAQALTGELATAAGALRDSFDLDEQEYLASGQYTKELLAAAERVGLAMYVEDERLLCYPSLLRVVPGEAAVEIDRKRERRLRPSVLVGLLAAAQGRGPRFRPEPFLDGLRAGYDLVVARESKKTDAVVRLVDVWAVLTLLPGQSRDYTKQEFARDLYLLDQSGVTGTQRSAGRTLRWAASTGTKGSGVLTTVARSGQQQRYWGISFAGEETEAS